MKGRFLKNEAIERFKNHLREEEKGRIQSKNICGMCERLWLLQAVKKYGKIL